jgi:hypothetical protein
MEVICERAEEDSPCSHELADPSPETDHDHVVRNTGSPLRADQKSQFVPEAKNEGPWDNRCIDGLVFKLEIGENIRSLRNLFKKKTTLALAKMRIARLHATLLRLAIACKSKHPFGRFHCDAELGWWPEGWFIGLLQWCEPGCGDKLARDETSLRQNGARSIGSTEQS